MTVLYGPDVSSNQPKNVLSKIKYDFGIVKMSGNPQGYSWNYVNPYAAQQAKDAYNKTGCLGLYHFTYGLADATKEADFFVNEVKKLGYLNKAILIIDYEGDGALDRGRSWVKKFADRIKSKAGYAPIIYASGSVIVSQNLTSLGYELWCANYYNGYDAMYGWSTGNCKIYPGCEKSILWQYTSQGYIDGYNGALDCNAFFGNKAKWQQLAGMKSTPADTAPTPTPATPSNKKSITTIAKEVIAGKWGTGSTRKTKLEKAGYDYNKVQNKVNDILYTNIAKEVIAGKWGNGATRKKKLEAAGWNYNKVQEKVNSLM